MLVHCPVNTVPLLHSKKGNQIQNWLTYLVLSEVFHIRFFFILLRFKPIYDVVFFLFLRLKIDSIWFHPFALVIQNHYFDVQCTAFTQSI